MEEEQVILVDADDNEIGTMGKQVAHEIGALHRAISVFIFDPENRLLLQQRARSKYHTPELWTNTCCSHPAPGEDTLGAAHRRLAEEMGMEAELEFAFSFEYKAQFDNRLIEHERDHVFIGWSEATPVLNKDEAQDFRWCSRQDISSEIAQYPETFTAWFKLIHERVFDLILERKR